MTRFRALGYMLMICGSLAGTARAETGQGDQAVFGFGGFLTKDDMLSSADPVRVRYEGNAIFGGGFQSFGPRRGALQFGLEVGVAARVGGHVSHEVWGGGVLRHDGYSLGRDLRLVPAFTAGLSRVTSTHRGREADLQERYQGSASTLFYLGPELALSRPSAPNTEVFWRLHHRSGGWRTLGNMRGAMNANVIGLRYRF